MENQFTLQGLALLTPDLKELISVKESPIFQEIKNRMFAKMRAEFAQREKIMIQWEANGFLLPGAREAMAAKFEEMLSRYINEPDENHLLLQDAQKSDRKTAQDAYDAWLFTARPTPAQALLGAAKMRAELRAAGIIEDGPGASPVGGSVVSSSPTRPAPAVAPTVAPKPLAGAAALPPVERIRGVFPIKPNRFACFFRQPIRRYSSHRRPKNRHRKTVRHRYRTHSADDVSR